MTIWFRCSADGKYEVSYKPNVVVFHTGDILWIPPAIYKSSCTIDVEYFPFDRQDCEMKFGSWTFNGEQVTLDWYEGHRQVDLSDYVNSGTWDIVACPGRYNDTFDAAEGRRRAQITFTLSLRRKTLFYTVNLIVPCVLISFLSVCVFYLPADAGEKMTMCVSILLALIVFLLLVSKILPPTSITIPLIAKYLLFTFIMNIVTILITVIIINWNFRTPRTHRMPSALRLVFLNLLPRALFMERPLHAIRWNKKAYSLRLARRRSAVIFHPPAAATTAALSVAGPPIVDQSTRRSVPACTIGSRNTAAAHIACAAHNDIQPVMRKSNPDEAMTTSGSGRAVCLSHKMGHVVRSTARVGQCVFVTAAAGASRLDASKMEETTSESDWCSLEARSAAKAVTFVAARLKNEDDYSEVGKALGRGGRVTISLHSLFLSITNEPIKL